MARSITALVAKGLAIAYGYVALAVAVLYSITRRDTWHTPTEDDKKRFEQACKEIWGLSDSEGDLSHNFLTLQNGLQLHYLSNKPAPASLCSLIIFIHGFPDTCYLWEQQMRSGIGQSSRMIALDLPGCGGSDSYSSYGANEMLNAVAEAIVQLKDCYLEASSNLQPPPKTILVSHDWGGVIAARLAGETSGLADAVVVMNSSYSLSSSDRIASLLGRSCAAIKAGNIKSAWLYVRPIISQLLMSNYIFMLSLRLPLAKWMPWLAESLVKTCHELALRNSPTATQSTYTKSLAASYGPSPTDCSSQTLGGLTYGPTVKLRAWETPQGDWDERVRIYSEGLALGDWQPDYPGHQAPLWKSSPERMRKGRFSCAVHVLFGMQDVALHPGIVVDGIEAYMLDADEGLRKPQVQAGTDVQHQSIGRSSIVKLPLCGHWSMLDGQGSKALDDLMHRLIN